MSWFAVDDAFPAHPKVQRLLDQHPDGAMPAIALWTLAGAWCCQQQTNRYTGRVPVHALRQWGDKAALTASAGLLVDVGLWVPVADSDGVLAAWEFHDWSDWNGPDARAHRNRTQTAERQRQKRWSDCRTGVKHSKDCPTQTPDGEPWECPKRAEKQARNDASRDAGTGRDGTGRAGTGRAHLREVVSSPEVCPICDGEVSKSGCSPVKCQGEAVSR